MKKYYLYIILFFVFSQHVFCMTSILVDILDSTGESVKNIFGNMQRNSNAYDIPSICYGTHGNARNMAERAFVSQQIQPITQQLPRCHVEIFLLTAIRNVRTLNNYTIIISQPYPPCKTPFLGTYNNAKGQTITEFNPGQRCHDWVQNFANTNRCIAIFQIPGRDNIVYRL